MTSGIRRRRASRAQEQATENMQFLCKILHLNHFCLSLGDLKRARERERKGVDVLRLEGIKASDLHCTLSIH